MLKIEINTSHSTSANTRILRVLADKLEGDVLAGPIYDINGTRVGKFSFDEED